MTNPLNFRHQDLIDESVPVHVARHGDGVECRCQMRGYQSAEFCLVGCHSDLPFPRLVAGLTSRSVWVREIHRRSAARIAHQLAEHRKQAESKDSRGDEFPVGEAINSAVSEGDGHEDSDEGRHLGGLAKNRPVHVRSEFFASDAGQRLDVGTTLCRDPCGLPLRDSGLLQTESGRELCCVACRFAGSFKRSGHV